MKTKKPVHLLGPSLIHTYTTVCGMSIHATYESTSNKRKVTCKRCRKTKTFKNRQ